MTSLILRSTWVVTFFVTLSQLPFGGPQPVDSLTVLKQTLSEAGKDYDVISVKKTRLAREISYCPDTSELFTAPNSTPAAALADFAFTYIFFASGDTSLRDFISRTGRPHSRVVLDRNRGGCTDDEEIALASCVLRTLSKRWSIRVFFMRYDEGAWHKSAVNLDYETSVNALTNVRAWRAEEWRPLFEQKFTQSKVVAIIRVEAGATGPYWSQIYRARVNDAFKGTESGQVIYLWGGNVGGQNAYGIGQDYLVMLRDGRKPVDDVVASFVPQNEPLYEAICLNDPILLWRSPDRPAPPLFPTGESVFLFACPEPPFSHALEPGANIFRGWIGRDEVLEYLKKLAAAELAKPHAGA